MPTFGSLFAGIGGIDLGLERAGWDCRFQVEWDAYCQRVLAKHWPDVPRYGDIHDVHGADACPLLADAECGGFMEADGESGRMGREERSNEGAPRGAPPSSDGRCSGCLPRVDLLAGGFPCQPFSAAGKQRRLADDRWLWPEFARVIRELRPRYVLVENVPGLLVGGGMGAVLGDLAALGYDAEWESIPAAAVGAPHLRYRVWIVAYANGHGPAQRGQRETAEGASPRRDDGRGRGNGHPQGQEPVRSAGQAGTLAYSQEQPVWTGLRAGEPTGVGGRRPGNGGSPHDVVDALGQRGRSRDDPREHAADAHPPGQGVRPGWDSHGWATEPDVGRVAHGVPARVDRLRALGNAVVPQIPEWIGRRILEAERVA